MSSHIMRAASAACIFLLLGRTVSSQPCRCTDPDDACWPTADKWSALNASVSGQLMVPVDPAQLCHIDLNSQQCTDRLNVMSETPYYAMESPGGYQHTGWEGVWNVSLSTYAVAARSAADVQATVNFAREHNLRLVVKGTGHEWFGRSQAVRSTAAAVDLAFGEYCVAGQQRLGHSGCWGGMGGRVRECPVTRSLCVVGSLPFCRCCRQLCAWRYPIPKSGG